MPLTDVAVRNATPRDKPYRLADAAGMYLEVMPNGSKYWRLKYRFAGKEKRLAIGIYPSVSISDARRKRDEARLKLADGIDPAETKKAEKRAQRQSVANSFQAVALEWYAKYAPSWSDIYQTKVLKRLQQHIFPWLGSRPIGELKPVDVLEVVRRAENRGHLETAHRIRKITGQVMRYGVATGRAERDITTDLKGAIAPVQRQHLGAITDPSKVGDLLRAIDRYTGTYIVVCALRLSPLVFQRPGELRKAEWSEFDLHSGTWEIPSARMKRRKAQKEAGESHIVPLSKQAVTVLLQLQEVTGTKKHLFPNVRRPTHYMSENTLNDALRSLGFDGKTMTGHGFRAMARTILDEVLEHPPHIIEAQLAHTVRDPLGRAYNRTKHLSQRRAMMQRWADYLDELKNGAKVLQFSAPIS
ncbi:tyrosine-type recombinase/integrase [Ralstonia insidiosa]|uniref:Integrase arm-type DNA-binding domain-containing protein n=1 Tax=Ralstonia insidiosa TaxID=190721 RepID=A0A848PBT5_9RALS|nr:integrase arm-type DNA-binding domain-containing protein [Ralstonia insidiosa]NMV42056.1 integrase arm-type DNA-binding domain-containing protein [Ralstonia insidiosa]